MTVGLRRTKCLVHGWGRKYCSRSVNTDDVVIYQFTQKLWSITVGVNVS